MVSARHLTVIAALALAAPAAKLNAQQPWGQPGYAYGSYSGYSQVAQDEGYRRGLLAGQEDRRRGAPFNFTGESDYRHADVGYRSEFGSRDQYREEFRSAFAAGYREGYSNLDSRRYGPPGPPAWSNGRARGAYNNGYYNQYGRSDLAFNTGYADGYDEGLNDGRKNHRNDPLAESRYRNGDHGYERNYGAIETYRSNYRQGFTNGYEIGRAHV